MHCNIFKLAGKKYAFIRQSKQEQNVKKVTALLVFLLSIMFFVSGAQAQVGGIQPDGVGGGAPGKPGAISGPTSISPGTTTSSYSTTTASGATSYAWSLSPSSAGSISGSSTSATVTWNSSYAGSVGVYVSGVNTSGMGTPSILTVTVIAPLVASVVSPSTQNIEYNSSPSLTASASSGGTGTYNYQWQSSTDQSTWTNYGAAGLTFPTGNLTSNTYFRMQTISGTQTANSNFATITVSPLLTGVNISPANQSVNYGSSPATLTATPVGGSGNFTSSIWQSSTDGVNWGKSLGTGLTYPPPANNTSLIYQITLTTSTNVTVHNTTAVNFYPQVQAPVISCATTSINYNTSPAITSPVPQGGSGSYTVQWQSSTNGSSWTNVGSPIPTSTSGGTLTMPTDYITANTYFQLVCSSNGSANVPSNQILVTVYPQLVSGNVTSGSQNINYNTKPTTLSVANATGGNGTIGYQWQSSPTGNTGTYTSVTTGTGSITTSYSPDPLTSTTYYQVLAFSGNPLVYVPSSQITVTVYPQLVAGTITSGTQNINYGATPSPIVSAAATGGNGTYTYQWQIYSAATGWSNVTNGTGGTTTSYQPPPLTATTSYQLISTSNNVSVSNAVITITVYPQLVAGSITQGSQTISYGATPTLNLLSNPPTGGSGTYTYQWQSSLNTTNWTSVALGTGTSSGTGLTYTIPSGLTATTYYRLVTTSNNVNAYSGYATVTVYPQITPGTIAAQSINYSTPPSFSVLASGGNNSYSYQLLTSPTSTGTFVPSGSAVAGNNTTAATVTGATITTSAYFELATTSYGTTVTTAPVLVTVYPQLVTGVITGGNNQTINYNTAPAVITVAAATGGNGSYSYKWQNSTNGGSTWTAIAGDTSLSYTPPVLTSTTLYQLVATSNGSTASSGVITITVYPQLVSGAVTPATQSIAPNTIPSTITSAPPRGGNGTYLLQWQSSSDNINFSNVNGATMLSYTRTTAVTSNIYYRLIIISNGVTAVNNTSAVIVTDCLVLNSNPNNSMNFVVSNTFRTTGVLSTTPAQVAAMTACNVNQTIQYFDGLGRLIQTVGVKESPKDNDVVQPVAYDAYGRLSTKYLPYTSTVNDGSFKPSALNGSSGYSNSDQNNFYTTPPQGVNQIVDPFAQTNYEPSPLNRVVEQGAPGAAWQPVAGNTSGNTNKTAYIANDAIALSDTAHSHLVQMYSVTLNSDGSSTLTQGGGSAAYYAAGQLYLTVSQGENWRSGRGGTTEEYKDYQGQTVLKRTFNYTGGVLQILSTYYVYDDYGNLSFVLPPASGADTALPSSSILSNLCYQYNYDQRNRLSQKKLPGMAWEYVVYNQLDQPVLTQDGNQQTTNQWTVTKFDAFGRVIVTGLWNAGSVISLSTLQASIYAGSQWDQRDYSNNTSLNPTGYSISSYPALSQVLTVNYYDDYTAPGWPSAKYVAPSGAGTVNVGLLTATKTAVLNTITNTTPDMLWDIFYYDGLARDIQHYKQHYFGGTANLSFNNYDAITSNYNFANEVTSTIRQHYNYTNITSAIVTIRNTYIYDQTGRKIQSFESINGGTNVLIEQNDFNEIGQVMTRHLHSETGSAPFLQDIPYTYNERGWLLTAGTAANLFNYSLQYNNPDAGISKQYNGNISEMLYSGTTSGNKTFSYSYDQLNRLTSATSTSNSLNEQINYDLMGNITALTRTGSSPAVLDYTYLNNNQSNQLQTVTNGGSAFRSYGYDNNGNATSDGTNKNIIYNLLNLPQTVMQNASTLATYTYDATGQKLRNTGSDGTWDYIDGIVYNNPPGNTGSVIQFIQTEAGRIAYNNGTYSYEYNLTDHLGNVRVSFGKNSTTGLAQELQEDEYYSFGLRSPRYNNSNNNRYLYNGKEVQTDLTNQYDYGARFYDPVIARWNVPDPDAENYESTSLYAYVLNNPINLGDVDGRDTLKTVYIHATRTPKPKPEPEPIEPLKEIKPIEYGVFIKPPVFLMPVLTLVFVLMPANYDDHEEADNLRLMNARRDPKHPGSYTIKFKNGKRYHGQGSFARALESAKYRAKQNNTSFDISDIDWTPADNDAQAYRDEARRLENDGGKDNPDNYNERDSPGSHKYKQDK